MKKFLFTTLMTNDLGLLTRSLPIARELRDRGNEVVFSHPAKAPRQIISDADFENIPPKWPMHYILTGDFSLSSIYKILRSRNFLRDLSIFISFGKNMNQYSSSECWNIDQMMCYGGMCLENLVRADSTAYIELIQDYKPDVVVDFGNLGACIAARALKIPLITVLQANIHPQSDGFIWWKEPPPDLPSPVQSINNVLVEHQLKPIHKTGDLFIGEKTLVVGMPETDPLPETADVIYVGAVLWQKSKENMPDWFAKLETTKPVIWLYSGNPQYVKRIKSAGDSAVVLYSCIEALKNEPVQVVLSTGHQPLPKNALSLPSNFRHVSFIPGLTMAERSDLLIHHGGYGSCQTGFLTGTPAFIIPTFSERESNARRVAAVGAGDIVLPVTDDTGKNKHVNAKEVREKVNHILTDSSFKENAMRISEKLKTYGGAPYAASLIEESL